MRISEIVKNESSVLPKSIKPLTPQQARLDSLKKQKDNVGKALDSERKRQKVTKAQQQLQRVLGENLSA